MKKFFESAYKILTAITGVIVSVLGIFLVFRKGGDDILNDDNDLAGKESDIDNKLDELENKEYDVDDMTDSEKR